MTDLDFKTTEDTTVVGVDSRGHELTHFVLAERLLQVEYATVRDEILEHRASATLTRILKDGSRGFHTYTGGEQWSAWRDGAEAKFYALYDADGLPWDLFDDDPLLAEQSPA